VNLLFGPIQSRRFGKSLGIDLSPQRKQCNYDCLYCELPSVHTTDQQTDPLPVEAFEEAIRSQLHRHPDLDVLTLTANGEPTLYPHLNELIDRINAFKGPIQTLILSNGSTIADPAVQEALLKIDTVKLSLDCAMPRCFKRLDRAHSRIDIETIKKGMLTFKARTTHPLIIEILIVEGINDRPTEIEALNAFLMMLRPDRIDLGTIDRPPAYDVHPLGYDRLYTLSQMFDPALPVHITQRKHGNATPGSYDEAAILSTLTKRPLTPEDVAILFDLPSQKLLDALHKKGKVILKNNNGVDFFSVSSKDH
jgi:wyosine [tRNA(Phe)-imidazoG37] synthetase (radical SAM superfamily)